MGSKDETAVAVRDERGVATLAAYMPQNLSEAMRLAEILAGSGAMPYTSPGEVFAVAMAGARYGLDPMTASRLLYVINDRGKSQVGITATGARALVEASGMCEAFDLIDDPSRNELQRATFRCKRPGRPGVDVTFSRDDATRAGLWGKKTAKGYDTPWTAYPGEMLIARSTMKAARLVWPDVLGGFYSRDELTSGAAADPDIIEAHIIEPEPQTAQSARPTQRQERRSDPAPDAQRCSAGAASQIMTEAGLDPCVVRAWFVALDKGDIADDAFDGARRRKAVIYAMSDDGRAALARWVAEPPAKRRATWAGLCEVLDAFGIPAAAYAAWRTAHQRDTLSEADDTTQSGPFHLGGALHKFERGEVSQVLAWMDEQHAVSAARDEEEGRS